MAGKVTWKDAIKKVLRETDNPLHYTDIAKIIVKKKYKFTLGITPRKTVYTSLKRMIKNKDNDIFMVETGIFAYNKKNN
jgi:hypothetical protein